MTASVTDFFNFTKQASVNGVVAKNVVIRKLKQVMTLLRGVFFLYNVFY